MNSITIDNLLPHALQQNTSLHSEIWLKELTFRRGETYLLEAASGAGKSSLCSFIIGLRQDYNGSIRFDNTDIRCLHTHEWTNIRQRHVSLMFQQLRLFPELTAWENVEIKNSLTRHKTKHELKQWFEALGIADKMHEPVGRMSIGQQQRVAMMRALAQPFDFLLADEPVSHLDDDNSLLLSHILKEEADRQQAGIIVTSIGRHMPLNYTKTYHL